MPKKNKNFLIIVFLSPFMILGCTSKEDKAQEFIKSAEAYLVQGQFNKAEIEYKNALQVNQQLINAWMGLAQVYEKQRDWRKSLSALYKIKEIAPSHIDGRLKLGRLLLAANQFDKALLDANELIDLAPDNA